MTIIAKLWNQLDEQIELAVPLQRRIKILQSKQNEDPASAAELEIELLELQIEKYQRAGFAPGLAQALCELCFPHFDTYKDVVKHAQQRYKAKQAGETITTPGLSGYMPVGDKKASAAEAAIAEGEDVTVAEHEQTVAESAPEEKAPPRARRRARPDPGPSVDDVLESSVADEAAEKIAARDAGKGVEDLASREKVWGTAADDSLEKLEKLKPGSKERIEKALAGARAKVAERTAELRPDDTDEAQDANHREDLGSVDPEEVSESARSGGEERSPADVADLLASLEDS